MFVRLDLGHLDTALLCRELVEEFQVQDFNLFAGAYKLKLFKALQLVTCSRLVRMILEM